jgi:ferredoxin
MPKIVFLNEGRRAEVAAGTTVLEAADALRVPIGRVCGGGGTCSTCRVEVVVDGLSPINPQEEAYTMGDGRRLGCQAKVMGNCAVRALMIPKVELY